MNLSDQTIENIIEKIDFRDIGKHPNIMIAARIWEDERYEAALTCYKTLRMIDDLIDDNRAKGETLSCFEKQALTNQVKNWLSCLDVPGKDDKLVNNAAEVIAKFKIPLQYFHCFASSMIYDIDHNGFDTFKDFLEYAEGASNCPASVFVHLCCVERNDGGFEVPPFDIASISRPCAMFSYLVHIIRDFRKDQAENLNYFATDILEKHGLRQGDLKQIAQSAELPASFRKVIAEYITHAEGYRQETIKMINWLQDKIHKRYLLSLRLIFDLYLQVYERIDPVKGTFTSEELIPDPDELKKRVYRLINSHHPGVLVI
jgi:phytoene/squalene synthetase